MLIRAEPIIDLFRFAGCDLWRGTTCSLWERLECCTGFAPTCGCTTLPHSRRRSIWIRRSYGPSSRGILIMSIRPREVSTDGNTCAYFDQEEYHISMSLISEPDSTVRMICRNPLPNSTQSQSSSSCARPLSRSCQRSLRHGRSLI